MNFPPKQVANAMSDVLVLGATPAADDVALLGVDEDVPLGTRIG